MEQLNAASVMEGSGIVYDTPMMKVHLKQVNYVRCDLGTKVLLQ